MKGIFLILIFLVLGVGIGLIFGFVIPKIENYFLARKIKKKAIETKKNFKYKEVAYDIKAEIEKQLIEYNKMRINRRKMKGGNKKNGNTIQSGNEGLDNQGTNEGVEQTQAITTDSSSSTASSTTDSRESRQNINRNLLQKGRKFY